MKTQREAMGVVYQVCDTRGVTPEAVLSRNRRMDLVSARRSVAHTLRLRGWSLNEIGYALGRNHQTIFSLLRGREIVGLSHEAGGQMRHANWYLNETMLRDPDPQFAVLDKLIEAGWGEISQHKIPGMMARGEKPTEHEQHACPECGIDLSPFQRICTACGETGKATKEPRRYSATPCRCGARINRLSKLCAKCAGKETWARRLRKNTISTPKQIQQGMLDNAVTAQVEHPPSDTSGAVILPAPQCCQGWPRSGE